MRTHTYVKCGVTQKAFDEVKRIFEAHGYQDQIHDDGKRLDMHGIALVVKTKCPICFGPLPCPEHPDN